MPTTNEENLGNLALTPPIPTAYELIMTAYLDACGSLTTLDESSRIKEGNRLFMGYRSGSKVIGVRDQHAVEVMFKKIMANGPKKPYPKVDHEGNQVYCFDLVHPYIGKGQSSYGYLSDMHELGKVNLGSVGIGRKFTEGKTADEDSEILIMQAPKHDPLKSNIITVILSADNSTFLAWFCGYPRKRWTKDTVMALLTVDGRLDLSNVDIEVGIDNDLITDEIKRDRRRATQDRRRIEHAQRVANPVNPQLKTDGSKTPSNANYGRRNESYSYRVHRHNSPPLQTMGDMIDAAIVAEHMPALEAEAALTGETQQQP